MKLSKKILCSFIAVLMFVSCVMFAGCEISTEHLMANYEGKFAYKSALNTLDNTNYDYALGGNVTLVIRDGKAVFKNDAQGTKNYVYYLDASIFGSSLKLVGDGYYYVDGAATRADYVFGSGVFDGDKLVVRLMFIDYARSETTTKLQCALTLTFERV